jgi:hypothetical protein
MPKTTYFGLSKTEIKNAIKDCEKFKKEFITKSQTLIQVLTEEGRIIAKYKVQALGAFYTGELERSIEGYFSPSLGVGIIYAGAWYAAYVEFGTGVRGADSPHPEPGKWQYDVNHHGEEGWWYFNDYDEKKHWTRGIKSRPFMYDTARQLETMCSRIAQEVFGANRTFEDFAKTTSGYV